MVLQGTVSDGYYWQQQLELRMTINVTITGTVGEARHIGYKYNQIVTQTCFITIYNLHHLFIFDVEVMSLL